MTRHRSSGPARARGQGEPRALRYDADFPDAVDERIRLDEDEARREEARWRRRQSMLG